MKTIFFVLLSIAFSAQAQTLLECKPTMGSLEVRNTIVANIVIGEEKVIMFQFFPFRTVDFDIKSAERETNRRGTVVHYQTEIAFEEVITLSLVESGKKRNAYLQMESVTFADEPFFEAIPLICTEQ